MNEKNPTQGTFAKKRMPDNMYKTTLLETKFSKKNGNVRCTLTCTLSDMDDVGKRDRLAKLLKQHPDIKIDKSKPFWYGMPIIITETAFRCPSDEYDETTGRHVAETKARLKLNRLMREFTLSETARFVAEAKKAAAWNEEYSRRAGELAMHLKTFRD